MVFASAGIPSWKYQEPNSGQKVQNVRSSVGGVPSDLVSGVGLTLDKVLVSLEVVELMIGNSQGC